ncbi:MAG: hypothetical protein K0R57_6314 [Paenibacillaceae bacterium]|nr:hypothetical protein [Paenibacillaceae bacterium]
MDNNHNRADLHSGVGNDPFFDQRMEAFPPLQNPGGPSPYPPFPPYMGPYSEMPRKRKFVAGLLAFFLPGTGHFYLGLMQKGLFMMLLFILNITAIVYTTNMNTMRDNSFIPFVVLLSCLIPVIYFYNLFDTLQSTDQVNAYRKAVQSGQIAPAPSGSDSLGRQVRGGTLGMTLMAIGLFLFLVSTKPVWLEDLFSMMGSYVGAVILIGAGLVLFLTESKKK